MAIIGFGTPRLSLQNKQQKSQKGWKNCPKIQLFAVKLSEMKLSFILRELRWPENLEENGGQKSK